jgi:hypothetical protein
VTTLLVLGSKPQPALPAPAAIDAVACANASGHSAAQHGLPVPAFTVMSAILTSGQPAARQSISKLAGLRTGTLFLLPRPAKRGGALRRALRQIRSVRTSPAWFRFALRRAGYRWERLEVRPLEAYHQLVRELCGRDPAVSDQLARKQPSTGLFAVALGLADPRYQRVVVAGMSFELTHAYGENPEIASRGTLVSKHADTDVLVLGRLARHSGRLFTTEKIVADRAGVPLWDDGLVR